MSLSFLESMINKLLDNAVEEEWAGKIVIKKNQEISLPKQNYIYLLQSGTLLINKQRNNGSEYIYDIASLGDVIGWERFYNNHEDEISVKAFRESVLIKIFPEYILNYSANYFSLMEYLFQQSLIQLRKYEERAIITAKNKEQRIKWAENKIKEVFDPTQLEKETFIKLISKLSKINFDIIHHYYKEHYLRRFSII